jgi:hypothetical protein
MFMSAEELQKAQEREYGEYVATTPIDIGGVRAFNVGDPVPKSHVDSGAVSKDSVARSNTKAAESATTPKEG